MFDGLSRFFCSLACPSALYFGPGAVTPVEREGVCIEAYFDVSPSNPDQYYARSYLKCDFSSCEDMFSKVLGERDRYQTLLDAQGFATPLPAGQAGLLAAMANVLDEDTRVPDADARRTALMLAKPCFTLSQTRREKLMMCLERSALAAHWMHRLGYESRVLSGVFSNGGKVSGGHAMAVYKNKENIALFDASLTHAFGAGFRVPPVFTVSHWQWELFKARGKNSECWLPLKNVWNGGTFYMGFASPPEPEEGVAIQQITARLVPPRL